MYKSLIVKYKKLHIKYETKAKQQKAVSDKFAFRIHLHLNIRMVFVCYACLKIAGCVFGVN